MPITQEFQTGIVTSPDGTKIGYRSIGTGPSLILMPGGLQSSLNFTRLAKAMSTGFKVYIPDRRGRGLSDPYRKQDGLLTEAGDLSSLIRTTGAERIFALSSGAIITLQATLSEPGLQKIALYEPPIPIDNTVLKRTVAKYDSAMQKENLGAAFVAILKGTGDVKDRSVLNILPSFITAPVVNSMMRRQLKKDNGTELPLAKLVPTFSHDARIISESLPLIDKAKNISAEVLLLGGSRSQSYLATALNHLEKSLRRVTRFEFEKLGHFAADNTESPLVVAETLRSFF